MKVALLARLCVKLTPNEDRWGSHIPFAITFYLWQLNFLLEVYTENYHVTGILQELL